MSFRDNLLHLRASNNMTQEQLAMMLNVSRQSVTKWEAEKSYPEMDKLLKLCQIFDCTLDELVQGDLTNREPTSSAASAACASPIKEDVFGYDEMMRTFAFRISNGVMAIILGIAVAVAVFSLSDPTSHYGSVVSDNIAGAMGTICMLAGIAIGLASILPACMTHSQFMREHPFIEDFYTGDQRAATRTLFTRELVGGIIAIMAGICAVVAFADTSLEDTLGVPCLLVLVAVGVRFIVHGGIMLSRINIAEYNAATGEVLSEEEISSAAVTDEQRRAMMTAHDEDKRIGAICGTIMLVATIIALMWLFLPMMGILPLSPSAAFFWLPWPLGGILCGITSLLIKGFGHQGQ